MALSWKGAPKDPEDVRDYGVDWTAPLEDRTIDSSTWLVKEGDVIVDDAIFDDHKTTVRFSGGTVASSPATITNHIVLDDGQELDLDCVLIIKERIIK